MINKTTWQVFRRNVYAGRTDLYGECTFVRETPTLVVLRNVHGNEIRFRKRDGKQHGAADQWCYPYINLPGAQETSV